MFCKWYNAFGHDNINSVDSGSKFISRIENENVYGVQWVDQI